MATKKRIRSKIKDPAPQLLQLCPRGRVRLDPSIVPAVITYALAYKRRHEVALKGEWDESKPDQRAAAVANRKWHATCCTAIDLFISACTETMPADLIDEIRDMLNGLTNPADADMIVRMDANGRLTTSLPME